MHSLEHQPAFTIDGVALGQRRGEVDRLLGCPATNANPRWARYKASADRPLLVGFRALWPQDPMENWVVESLSGSLLRVAERLVAQVGSSIDHVSRHIGPAVDHFRPEPGVICYDFSGFLVFCDEHSGKVLEISLRGESDGKAESLPLPAGRSNGDLTAAC